jgi:hypothetical protein
MQVSYAEHEVFEKPFNENAKIWRYLDFTKFVSLLDKRALFFSRADMLDDPFEGSFSKANLRLRSSVYKDKIPEDALRTMYAFQKQARRYTIVNCWNISDYESAALWRLYLRSGDGVAIQSTFSQLKRCFSPKAETKVFIGKVKYIDYETDWLPEGNVLYPFVHKRKSFEHERELRAIVQKFPQSLGHDQEKLGELVLTQNVFDKGEYVDVNLDVLVEKVYISPTSQEWFLRLVNSISNKYDLKKQIVQSSLVDDPVY